MTHPSASKSVIDVDFSLAIHNRTGKYFIGRDLLASCEGLVGHVYYWWFALRRPPTGLLGRLVGRLQLIQAALAARSPTWRRFRRRPARPVLHLDPFTVMAWELSPGDVVLCHDLGPVTHPRLFEARVSGIYLRAYDRIAEVGPHMVFVSEASQRAFDERHPGAVLRSSRVIYPAIRSDSTSGEIEHVPAVTAPFLLTVGYIGTRKNQAAAIAAFERSGLAREGVQYVLCGGREPGAEVVEQLAAITSGVILLPYVTDAQLRWLYRSASGLVLASLLEGFGMPVAEAMQHGLIPVVSAGSVLEEVAGSGAVAVDATDLGSIAEGMREVVHMAPADRERRSSELKSALDRFDPATIGLQWRICVAEVLAH